MQKVAQFAPRPFREWGRVHHPARWVAMPHRRPDGTREHRVVTALGRVLPRCAGVRYTRKD